MDLDDEELEATRKLHKNIWNIEEQEEIDIQSIEGYEEMEEVNKKFISVDKIKAKIEEIEQCELYNMKIPKLSTLDERLGAKIGIKYVLQSLLEKE